MSGNDLDDNEFRIVADPHLRDQGIKCIKNILSAHAIDTNISDMPREELNRLREASIYLNDEDTVCGLSKDHIGTLFERAKMNKITDAVSETDVITKMYYGCSISWSYEYAALTMMLLDNISVLPDFKSESELPTPADFRDSPNSFMPPNDRKRTMRMLVEYGFMTEKDTELCELMERYIEAAGKLFWNGTISLDMKDEFADVYKRLRAFCVSYRIELERMLYTKRKKRY